MRDGVAARRLPLGIKRFLGCNGADFALAAEERTFLMRQIGIASIEPSFLDDQEREESSGSISFEYRIGL